jgi:hypothetical protein
MILRPWHNRKTKAYRREETPLFFHYCSICASSFTIDGTVKIGGIGMLLATPWYWTWDGISAVGQWIGGIGTIIAVIVAFWQIQENRRLMTQPQIHVEQRVSGIKDQQDKITRPILSVKIINSGQIPTLISRAIIAFDSVLTIKEINKHNKRHIRSLNPFYITDIFIRLAKYQGLKKFNQSSSFMVYDRNLLRFHDNPFPQIIHSGESIELRCDLTRVFDYALRNLFTKVAQEKEEEFQPKEEYIETNAIHLKFSLSHPWIYQTFMIIDTRIEPILNHVQFFTSFGLYRAILPADWIEKLHDPERQEPISSLVKEILQNPC